MNVCNLWKGTALSVCFAALLPIVVGCDASESLENATNAHTSTQSHRLVVRFSPLKHGANESIGQDGSEQEDYVTKLYAMGGGRILGNPDVLAALVCLDALNGRALILLLLRPPLGRLLLTSMIATWSV